MTWLGDTEAKPNDTKRAALEKKRADIQKKIEAIGNPALKTYRFAHQKAHDIEDLTKLAKEMTKIDQKLGRPVDRNSGGV